MAGEVERQFSGDFTVENVSKVSFPLEHQTFIQTSTNSDEQRLIHAERRTLLR
jgi:hypothetical protein